MRAVRNRELLQEIAQFTLISELVLPAQANGSIVYVSGRPVGSAIIGQLWTNPQYFHGRPSAAGKGYDPTSTGETNLGPTPKKLIDSTRSAIAAVQKENPDAAGPVPLDLLTTSASGIDSGGCRPRDTAYLGISRRTTRQCFAAESGFGRYEVNGKLIKSLTIAMCAAAALSLVSPGLADPAPAPSTSPSPVASASPAVQVHEVISGTMAFTSNVNATGSLDTPTGADQGTRANVSNAFAILTKSSGTWQYALQAGAYSIPVVGVAGNKTIESNANTGLYGPAPLAYLEYAPTSSFNVSAGVLATLTGAESTYTYLNWNIQRGAVWNVENAVSRGMRATFSSGKFTTALGVNDGFYSGRFGAAEAAFTFAPDASDSLLFVALIPNSRTPGNPTAAVANKELLNLVFSRTRGKLQLAPYILYARSPTASGLGYKGPEAAFGGALLANWTLSPHFSTALRYETLHNSSRPGDTSANADLVGYGAGSGVNTYTVTPSWTNGHVFARVDLSTVRVTSPAAGLAFGENGAQRDQFRTMFEVGVQL